MSAYYQKMQLMLGQCPGFRACDAPASPASFGRVVVEGSYALQAESWLKRRFQVAEEVELERAIDGIAFRIHPRARRSVTLGGHRVKVSFAKPVQYELALA